MFSANENLALRQHKRRIVGDVESTIPDDALDMGTTAMVMQLSCKAPGCVPLETAIAIVFPRGQTEELIPGVQESGAAGGTFKTKILMPMSEVTRDDVLDALPPEFEGGRRTMERICLRARDATLSQIAQVMNEEDIEGKKLMAEYLMGCLKDYVDGGCKAPPPGEAFPPRAGDDGKGEGVGGVDADRSEDATSNAEKGPALGIVGSGNLILRRPLDDDDGNGDAASKASNDAFPVAANPTPRPSLLPLSTGESANDRRRRQALEREVSMSLQSASLGPMEKITQRECAPGIRRPGCPCCEPNSTANFVDSMLML